MSQQVSLRLDRVKCVDETGGANVEKFGNDEISLAGFGIDAAGKTVKLPPFTVYAHFDDGEVKSFAPGKTLLTLDVPNDGAFPKTCVASLILAEIDSGGLTSLVNEAFAKLSRETDVMTQRMKANSGALPVDIDWGEVWDVVRPIVYGYIKGEISKGIDDDVFPPQSVSVDIASPDFRWGDGTKLSPEATVEFRGHNGVYYVTYFWEIETV